MANEVPDVAAVGGHSNNWALPPQQHRIRPEQHQAHYTQYTNYSQDQQTPVPLKPTEQPVPAMQQQQQPSTSSFSTSQPPSSFTKTAGDIMTVKAADEEFEDGRVRNAEAGSKIRDAWIYTQISAREKEFTQYRNARIFLGTWNVNAKGKDESLESWLCAGWGARGEYAPDIVAVGLQEMVDLNAVNVAVENKSAQKSQTWVERIRMTLNSRPYSVGNDPNGTYILVQSKYLVGLMLCVFVKASHRARVKCVHSDSVGVGVMGMMGNKGGVSVRIQFYDSTLCFVNSHLAAHRENVIGRNSDFQNIFSKLQYDIGYEAAKQSIQNGSLSQWYSGSQTIGVSDHDMAFWIGDLNYRIDESMSTELVLNLSQKFDLEKLRRHDQLNIERKEGRVFQGWQEGELNFAPTYKYQPGTDMYEQRPDKKLRAPAWCDRVLWLTKDPSYLTQLNYSRSELNVSDHKPVMSMFVAVIKDVIQSEREKVYYSVMKRLDEYDNQSLPMVGLDRTELDFGEVRYGMSKTLQIRIANTGKVVAQFRLVPKLDEPSFCKPWLNVLPTYGMIIPNDNEIVVNFTINVNNDIARALNSGKEVLEDIIILRLENGRDYYITVKARYARSCFGMSADELVMYNDPIRSVPLDPIKRVEKYGTDKSAVLCVPKELWRIVDAIYGKGLQEMDLFSISGYQEEIDGIRESLDTGEPFGNFHIHSMTDVLVSFLTSLSSTIVPQSLLPTLEIDAQNVQVCARSLLEGLPPINYNVFVYMISFFRECLLHQQQNQLTTVKLARICVACLVTGGVIYESKQEAQRQKSMHLLMIHFLESSTI